MAEPRASDRQTVSTGTKYEFQFGYSRAVRRGDVIRVSGTAGLGEDGQVVSDDVVDQTRRALEIVRGALEELGASLEDVIMTRVYVSDVRSIDSVAVVHGEVFRDIRPASSILKVEFIDPRILVEVEAEALATGTKKEKA
jgi:enamine deaminase RidA (YjgF/YER057c/UK114 family)